MPEPSSTLEPPAEALPDTALLDPIYSYDQWSSLFSDPSLTYTEDLPSYLDYLRVSFLERGELDKQKEIDIQEFYANEIIGDSEVTDEEYQRIASESTAYRFDPDRESRLVSSVYGTEAADRFIASDYNTQLGVSNDAREALLATGDISYATLIKNDVGLVRSGNYLEQSSDGAGRRASEKAAIESYKSGYLDPRDMWQVNEGLNDSGFAGLTNFQSRQDDELFAVLGSILNEEAEGAGEGAATPLSDALQSITDREKHFGYDEFDPFYVKWWKEIFTDDPSEIDQVILDDLPEGLDEVQDRVIEKFIAKKKLSGVANEEQIKSLLSVEDKYSRDRVQTLVKELATRHANLQGVFKFHEDPKDDKKNLRVTEMGSVLAHPTLMSQRERFEKAVEDDDRLSEDQKRVLNDQRTLYMQGRVESLDEMFSEVDAVKDKWEAAKNSNPAGFKNDPVSFIDDFLSVGSNYDSAENVMDGVKSSLADSVMGIIHSIGAVAFKSEASAEYLIEHQKEESLRREAAAIFGKPFGLGYDLTTTIAPMIADIGATALLTVTTGYGGAAYASMKAGAGLTARATTKGVMKALTGSLLYVPPGLTAKKAAKELVTKELIENSGVAVGGATAAIKAFNGIIQNKFVINSNLFLTSANRSAGGMYGTIYASLPDDMSHEEKHDKALGHALLAGVVTGSIVSGMSAIGRGGFEDLLLRDMSYGSMKRVLESIRKAPISDRNLKDDLKKHIGKRINQIARKSLPSRLFTGAVNEGFEEGLDEFLNSFVEDAALDRKTPLRDKVMQAWHAAKIGAVMGSSVPVLRSGKDLINRVRGASYVDPDLFREQEINRAVQALNLTDSPLSAAELRKQLRQRGRQPAGTTKRGETGKDKPPLDKPDKPLTEITQEQKNAYFAQMQAFLADPGKNPPPTIPPALLASAEADGDLHIAKDGIILGIRGSDGNWVGEEPKTPTKKVPTKKVPTKKVPTKKTPTKKPAKIIPHTDFPLHEYTEEDIKQFTVTPEELAGEGETGRAQLKGVRKAFKQWRETNKDRLEAFGIVAQHTNKNILASARPGHEDGPGYIEIKSRVMRDYLSGIPKENRIAAFHATMAHEVMHAIEHSTIKAEYKKLRTKPHFTQDFDGYYNARKKEIYDALSDAEKIQTMRHYTYGESDDHYYVDGDYVRIKTDKNGKPIVKPRISGDMGKELGYWQIAAEFTRQIFETSRGSVDADGNALDWSELIDPDKVTGITSETRDKLAKYDNTSVNRDVPSSVLSFITKVAQRITVFAKGKKWDVNDPSDILAKHIDKINKRITEFWNIGLNQNLPTNPEQARAVVNDAITAEEARARERGDEEDLTDEEIVEADNALLRPEPAPEPETPNDIAYMQQLAEAEARGHDLSDPDLDPVVSDILYTTLANEILTPTQIEGIQKWLDGSYVPGGNILSEAGIAQWQQNLMEGSTNMTQVVSRLLDRTGQDSTLDARDENGHILHPSKRFKVAEPGSLQEFLATRPAVEGYVFHGSPSGDLESPDPTMGMFWTEGRGLYTTESMDVAAKYAAGRTTTQKDEAALAGRVNYIKINDDAVFLDMEAPADKAMWGRMADALGFEGEFNYDLGYKRWGAGTNGAAYLNYVTTAIEQHQGHPDEVRDSVIDYLANQFSGTTHMEWERTEPHRVRVLFGEYLGDEFTGDFRVVSPEEVYRDLVREETDMAEEAIMPPEAPQTVLPDGNRRMIPGTVFFAGGGLVEVGLPWVNWGVVVEYDPELAAIHKKAHGSNPTVQDVRDFVNSSKNLNRIPKNSYFHASPVCKGYSPINQHVGDSELDITTAEAVAKVIRERTPAIFTLENVKEYAYPANREALDIITKALEEGGYTWHGQVYNAADFGASTDRKRYLLRATRRGELPPVPQPTHGPTTDTPHVGWYDVVEDLIEDLPDMSLASLRRAKYIYRSFEMHEGGINPEDVPEPILVAGSTYHYRVKTARPNEPLFTLLADSNDVLRILLPGGRVKRVTSRLKARLTGLPDSYPLPSDSTATGADVKWTPKEKSLDDRSKTIVGNGVPPALAAAVFGPLIQQEIDIQEETMGDSDLSITPPPSDAARERDSYYLELAKDEEGNRDELQRLVDARAKEAGYDVGPVFHGTATRLGYKEFNVFDTDTFGSWFAEREDTAKTYIDQSLHRAGDEEVIVEGRMVSAYLKFNKLLVIPEDIDMSEDYKVEDALEAVNRENGTSFTLEDIGVPAGYEGGAWQYFGSGGDIFIGNAIKAGFDGMAATELGVWTYNAFNPNQIKVSDPVTRDEDGNVIPLSQRFDEEEERIDYSIVPIPINPRKLEEKRNPASDMPLEQVEKRLGDLINHARFSSGTFGVELKVDESQTAERGAFWSEGEEIYVNPYGLHELVDGLRDQDAKAEIESEIVRQAGSVASFRSITQKELDSIVENTQEDDFGMIISGLPADEQQISQARLASEDPAEAKAERERLVEKRINDFSVRLLRGHSVEEDRVFFQGNPGWIATTIYFLEGVLNRMWAAREARKQNPYLTTGIHNLVGELRLMKGSYRIPNNRMAFDRNKPEATMVALRDVLEQEDAEADEAVVPPAPTEADMADMAVVPPTDEAKKPPFRLSNVLSVLEVPVMEVGAYKKPPKWLQWATGSTDTRLRRLNEMRLQYYRMLNKELREYKEVFDQLIKDTYGSHKGAPIDLIAAATGSTRGMLIDDEVREQIDLDHREALSMINESYAGKAAERKLLIEKSEELKKARIDFEQEEKRKEIVQARDNALKIIAEDSEPLAKHLRELRGKVDEMSSQVAQITGDRNPELKAHIDKQLGIYLTRSYKIFSDENWIDDVLTKDEHRELREEVKTQYIDFLKKERAAQIYDVNELQFAEDRDSDWSKLSFTGKMQEAMTQATQEISAQEAALHKEGKDYGDVLITDFLDEYRRGFWDSPSTEVTARTTDILRKKKNLPKFMLKLLGEYEGDTGDFNLMRTFMNVGTFAANNAMLSNMVKIGRPKGEPMDNWWFLTKQELDEIEATNPELWEKVKDWESVNKPTKGDQGAREAGMRAYDPTRAFMEKDEDGNMVNRGELFAPRELVEDIKTTLSFADRMSDKDALAGKLDGTLRRMTGMALGAKTLGSVPFYIRNIISNVLFFGPAQGVMPMGKMFFKSPDGQIGGTLASELSRKLSRPDKVDAYSSRLIKLGVLDNELTSSMLKALKEGRMGEENILNDMNKLLDDAAKEAGLTDIDTASASGRKKILKLIQEGGQEVTKGWDAVMNKLRNLSEVVDSFYKIAYFETELATMRKAQEAAKAGDRIATMSDAQLEEEAARKVKMTAQSYSQAPPVVAAMQDSAMGVMFAPYFRFKLEVPRIMINTYKLGIEEVRSGNSALVWRGTKRLTGMSGMVVGLSMLGKTLGEKVVVSILNAFGAEAEDDELTEEQEAIIRLGAPRFLRSHTFYFFKLNGELHSLDLTYVNPFAMYADAVPRAWEHLKRGDEGEAIASFVDTLINVPFLDGQIAMTSFMQAKNNTDADGRRLWKDTDSAYNKMWKAGMHVFSSAYAPPTLARLSKLWASEQASREAFMETPYGLISHELLPFKPYKIDPSQVKYRIMRDLGEDMTMSEGEVRMLMTGKLLTQEQIERVAETHVQTHRRIGQVLKRVYSPLRELGVSQEEMSSSMNRFLTKDQISVLANENAMKVKPLSPSMIKIMSEAEEADRRERFLPYERKLYSLAPNGLIYLDES